MLEGKLSRRYGKAVFELAAAREEAVARELDSYLDVYLNSDLNRVLGNPAFPVGDRTKVALEIAEQLHLSASCTNLIAILVDRGRVDYLPSIVAYYHRLLDDWQGRVHATVIVPKPLADAKRAELGQLVSQLSGKQAMLTETVDPSIIGGVVIEVGGTVYDGTVRTQLEGLKQNIERAL